MTATETITTQIQNVLAQRDLLSHPMYQAWEHGVLPLETIKAYSMQYYHHVNAFAQYISCIHSQAPDMEARLELIDNIIEEEKGRHPDLWVQFVEGVGGSREEAQQMKLFPKTEELVKTFFSIARKSYATGLGALYAYEYQVPRIAEFKSKALADYYNVSDERSLLFFKVHAEADIYHSASIAALVERLSPEEKQEALAGAEAASKALWAFLDGVMEETGTKLDGCGSCGTSTVH